MLIADSGEPVLSSTGTLTIQVCSCDDDGHVLSCSPEAYMLPVSLSRGALIAILACIFVLLGEWCLSVHWGPVVILLSYQCHHPHSTIQNWSSTPCSLKGWKNKPEKSKETEYSALFQGSSARTKAHRFNQQHIVWTRASD